MESRATHDRGPAEANTAPAVNPFFRLHHYECAQARRLRTSAGRKACVLPRLVHPGLPKPPRQQPAAAREHFVRRVDLHPGSRDLTPTLLDERTCDRLDRMGLLLHRNANVAAARVFLLTSDTI
jgi:hypothetical protein